MHLFDAICDPAAEVPRRRGVLGVDRGAGGPPLYAARKSGRNRWVGAEVAMSALEKVISPASKWNIPGRLEQGEMSVVCNDGDSHSIVWQVARAGALCNALRRIRGVLRCRLML